jgi:hypothetical protein
MRLDGYSKFSRGLRRVAIAMVASGTVAAPAAYAWGSNNIVLVPPTALPESARQGGEAMFLYATVDGRTLLYIEHDQGARLAILDVTDPDQIKAEGTVPLDASGPLDFVSILGQQAELVRFRRGQGNAVLDLHRVKLPTLRRIEGLTLQGQTMPLGGDGFIVSTPTGAEVRSARDYQLFDTTSSQELYRVFDVTQVQQEIENTVTGTTFLLTQSGLYLVRRPAVEMDRKLRERLYDN